MTCSYYILILYLDEINWNWWGLGMKMNGTGRCVLGCFVEHEGGGAEDLSSAHKAEGWGLALTGGWNELLLLTTCLNCS